MFTCLERRAREMQRFSQCVCVSLCACLCMHACVHPCLQGEVEADALAAGLARLSGPNLQRRKREG